MKWYLMVLRKYAIFKGRASRREYWMFSLFNFIFVCPYLIYIYIYGEQGAPLADTIFLIYALATLIPSLAVTIRRLHDSNKTGWLYFVSLVPVIGNLCLLVLLCTEGDPETNKYGDDPYAAMV